MDRGQPNQHDRQPPERLPYPRSHPSSQQTRRRQNVPLRHARPTSSTTPASPPHWESTASDNRSRGWEHQRQRALPVVHSSRGVPPFEDQARSGISQRRRPSRLDNIPTRDELEVQSIGMNSSLLYPQASPYVEYANWPTAADQVERSMRAVSQPNTPFFTQEPSQFREYDQAPSYLPPRSPTYPPASRRRTHSTNNLSETTFTDPEEFHLFAQATAGLGPEQAFRQPHISSLGSSRYTDANTRSRIAESYSRSERDVSPVQETPTTMYALHQLAQMPQGSNANHYQHAASLSRPLPQGRDTRGVDVWLHSPDHPYEEELSLDDDGDDDDELPDYASSQAQVQAARREEAARRAQELQRRWQESR